MLSNHFILCPSLLSLPSIFPSMGSFPMSQFFTSGLQSTGASASASVLPMHIQEKKKKVKSLSHVRLFATPWAAARQASLSFTISWSLLKLMSTESVMPSNHLILCCCFSSCPQSSPASGSFPVSQLFASGGQSIGASASASASVLPVNIQG